MLGRMYWPGHNWGMAALTATVIALCIAAVAPKTALALADGKSELDAQMSQQRCAQICADLDFLTYCYYWRSTQTCRLSNHDAAQLRMQGSYQIYSRRLHRWMTRADLNLPSTPPPPAQPISVVGVWGWTAICGQQRFGGALNFHKPGSDPRAGTFSASGGGGVILDYSVNGNRLVFRRDVRKEIQTWRGTVQNKNLITGKAVGKNTSCDFELRRR